MEKRILITGGAGFIGSHVVRRMVNEYPSYQVVNLDLLTYAGNLENLKDIEAQPNYNFIKGDIANETLVQQLIDEYEFDGIIHLAAESHVDRSIDDPLAFAQTNIVGTIVLLNAFRDRYQDQWHNKRFYHISTDEVYGSLGQNGFFTEESPYSPNSPYSASKASADHFVRAYGETYGLPYVISNCSNNYGPNQFPEKLIPLFIKNILKEKPLPLYGDGKNTRDWLYVIDHAAAIDLVYHQGRVGETYNIGGFNEWKNIELVQLLCRLMDEKLGRSPGSSENLVTFVTDRPGHDLRYAIDATKINKELGWEPSVTFEEGLSATIDWYLSNQEWLDHIARGTYRKYYHKISQASNNKH